MYNASLLNSDPCYSPRLSSSPYNAIQRFVMYNATNAATWLWAPQRFATRLRVLRRASPQFNSTICLSIYPRLEPQLYSTSRNVTLRNSTICLSIYYCYASQRSAPHCLSTRRASTIYLLLRDATWLIASLRSSTQRYDLFIILIAPRRSVPPRTVLQHGSTQRFVCYNASPRIAPKHITLLRADHQRNATN